MTIMGKVATFLLGIAAFAAVMSWSGNVQPSTPGELFSTAEARVGRPLTPVSYAGVARRTTRRAVAACTPVYDAYGRVVRAC